MHKTKESVYSKLHYLEVEQSADNEVTENIEVLETMDLKDEQEKNGQVEQEQQVITDNQEYYEVCNMTVIDAPPEASMKPYIKILPRVEINGDEEPPKKIRKHPGRKKRMPVPTDIPPIKILPKPIVLNGPKIVQYRDDTVKPAESRSQVIDKLIEKVLKENTNEIDVFFRSMAASVKKLQPNLIPKVKMEVCNVIAKYEMQSFDKNSQNF